MKLAAIVGGSAFTTATVLTGCDAAPTSARAESYWRTLFNGHDLEGWTVSADAAPHWSVDEGVLVFDGVGGDLWTTASFENFELLVSWRWIGPSQGTVERPLIDVDGSYRLDDSGERMTVPVEERDSGIYLRGSSKSQVNIWAWPAGSGEVYGYRTDASMPAETRAAATPLQRGDRPVGAWNDFRISLVGEILNVHLNGQHVIMDCPLPGVAAAGPIGLQAHGSAIEFRDLAIRPIGPKTRRYPAPGHGR